MTTITEPSNTAPDIKERSPIVVQSLAGMSLLVAVLIRLDEGLNGVKRVVFASPLYAWPVIILCLILAIAGPSQLRKRSIRWGGTNEHPQFVRIELREQIMLGGLAILLIIGQFITFSGIFEVNDTSRTGQQQISPIEMEPEQRAAISSVISPETSVPSVGRELSIREQGHIFLPVFPQSLLYVYERTEFMSGTPSDRYIAPVGLAVNIEVANNKPIHTKVRSYFADLEMDDGKWERIYSLPTSSSHVLYFEEGVHRERSVELKFEPALFDVVAESKTLASGELLTGWMFFEWSPELYENGKIRKVKITIENSQGERTEAEIDLLRDRADERGVSLFDVGRFAVKDSRAKVGNLSSLPIRPFRSE